jgi:hypothetical protein
MTKVQLPPQFQSHPECAAGIVTIDQAIVMIERGMLTHDGARYLFPPKVWILLPQKPELDNTEPLAEGENNDSRSISRKRRSYFGWLFCRCRHDRPKRKCIKKRSA